MRMRNPSSVNQSAHANTRSAETDGVDCGVHEERHHVGSEVLQFACVIDFEDGFSVCDDITVTVALAEVTAQQTADVRDDHHYAELRQLRQPERRRLP